jgi:hypothetical protein
VNVAGDGFVQAEENFPQPYTRFRFYNGLEIGDPKGRRSLRLTASNMPDFVITAEFTF